MQKPLRVVYLLSMPFSGTTLLSRLVAQHPSIASVGEMVNSILQFDPEHYLCSCGTKLSQCPFWNGVRSRMLRRGHKFELDDFDVTPPKFIAGLWYRASYLFPGFQNGALGSANFSKAMVESALSKTKLSKRIFALCDSILQESKKSILFDASKNPNLVFYLAGSRNIELKLIHMVRDPRAVAQSMMTNHSRKDFANCLNEWKLMNAKIDSVLAVFPRTDRLTIRYEDLCAAPSKFLNDLYRWLRAEPVCQTSTDQVCHHIIGNRMRLGRLDNVTIDNRWLSTLDRQHLQEARVLIGNYASRYGYAL